MNGRPGRPGTPRGGPSRQSSRGPGGPRRPGGSNDNVLPLITGVLGSSILAFSLYVFSQNPGLLGEIVHGADDGPCDHPTSACLECSESAGETCQSACDGYHPACEHGYQPDDEGRQPVIQAYRMSREASQPVDAEPANPGPKISIEKKKWLTDQEEETIKDRRLKEKQLRGKLQKELSEHLQKVKEIRDELHKEKKRKYPWE